MTDLTAFLMPTPRRAWRLGRCSMGTARPRQHLGRPPGVRHRMEAVMSERVVTYEGVDLHLSVEEYAALRLAAVDDPAEADQMCREFLRRTTPPAETDRAEEGL